MKKFFLFASAALVLASCSSEAEEAVIKPNETPEEEVFELTEIKLGGGAPTVSAETRAVNEVTAWSGTEEVGIFGVNEKTDAIGTDWDTIPDRNTMGITDERAVILLNEPATVASDGVVTFTNATPKFYFPRGNSKGYGYTFLGYYPYLGNTPTVSKDSIKVTGEFDGTQDIMAGKAVSAPTIILSTGNNSNGYNAKYIRDFKKAANDQSAYPKIDIKFKHLTSKIDVYLQQGSSYDSTMCNVYAAWFEVKKDYTITFEKKNVRDSVTTSLSFAGDTVYAYAIGGGVFDPNKDYKSGDVVKYNNVYYKFTSDHTGNGSWSEGDNIRFEAVAAERNTSNNYYKIFVTPEPVSNSGTATKTLHLVLKDDQTKDIPVTVESPLGGFEAGKAYTVKVKINGPEEIKVTASITPWVTGDTIKDVEI